MKLNRKTQPVVYRRIAIKTSLLSEQERRAALYADIALLCFGLAFVVFLFGILG